MVAVGEDDGVGEDVGLGTSVTATRIAVGEGYRVGVELGTRVAARTAAEVGVPRTRLRAEAGVELGARVAARTAAEVGVPRTRLRADVGAELGAPVAIRTAVEAGVVRIMLRAEVTVSGLGAEIAGLRTETSPTISATAANATLAMAQTGKRRCVGRPSHGIVADLWTTPPLRAAL